MFGDENPEVLYKILSKENWEISQNQDHLELTAQDDEFIHFSLESQLDRILSKYWKDVPEYVLLKVDPTKLPGKMVFEANPGGSAKYYHLYDGCIPLDAILDVKTVQN